MTLEKIIIMICLLIIVILLIRIITLKKSVREIGADFAARKSGDSNTQVTVSTRDRDICELATTLNETLEEIRKYYLLYHQGDKEVKDAIASLSHDIRTPLTAISGYLELLRGVEKSPEVEKYLMIIEERAKYMKNLAEEMFSYSVAVQSEEETVELEDINLNKALEDCIMENYGAIQKKGLELEIDITEEKIVRQANLPGLQRVLANLVSNAIKYSDGDLRITMDESGTIIFSNKAENLSSVSVDKLFGRFYTVHNAQNSTGLGLSIAKHFVEKMGGTIYAEYEDKRLSIILKL